MKLFTSSISPFARKCIISAKHLGIFDQIELVKSIVHPVERNDSIIAKNPLGQIPTLILDNGNAIYDSRVICEYLNELAQGNLFGTNQSEPNRWDILTEQSLADGMTDAAILVRYEQGIRPATYQWEEWVNGQLDKIHKGFAAFDEKARESLDRLDIGTISLICALDYISFRLTDLEWQNEYKNLAKWRIEFTQQFDVIASTAPKA